MSITVVTYAFLNSKKQLTQKQRVEAIMNYPMDTIVKRCKKDHAYSDEDMVILEKEFKRFFALSLVYDQKSGKGMYSTDVDNLWHTFILHTADYIAFCDQYLGFYLHHRPESDRKKTEQKQKELAEDFRQFIQNYEQLFEEDIHPIWLLDVCTA